MLFPQESKSKANCYCKVRLKLPNGGVGREYTCLLQSDILALLMNCVKYVVKEGSSGELTACDAWENLGKVDLSFSTTFRGVGCCASAARCAAGSPDACEHQPAHGAAPG